MNSLLAGVLIGLGGFAFISVGGGIQGALLFSLGLLSVLILKADLYTGWVCRPERYNIKMPLVLIGNALGAIMLGIISSGIIDPEFVSTVCANKLSHSVAHWFIASVFCGIFIGVAVRSWDKKQSELLTIFCVMGFILTGSEHVVADIYYFSAALMFNFDVLLKICVAALGNMTGGYLVLSLIDSNRG